MYVGFTALFFWAFFFCDDGLTVVFFKVGPVTATKLDLGKFTPASTPVEDPQFSGQKQLTYTPANAPAAAPPSRPAITYNYPQVRPFSNF
jgi:hypothetical protein